MVKENSNFEAWLLYIGILEDFEVQGIALKARIIHLVETTFISAQEPSLQLSYLVSDIA